MADHHTILVDCADRAGLVAEFSRELFELGLNIVSNDEHVDPDTRHFFMRTEVHGDVQESALIQALRPHVPSGGNLRIADKKPKKIVVMVTLEPHCVGDLLIRSEYGDMNGRVEAVVGNHDHLRPLVERFGVPYHFVSTEGLSREEHETKILDVLSSYTIDCLVLAKYMRILTPDFVRRYEDRMINIHHSFLPAFVGANPYRQAHDRGVKIIGATAHYVTADLDEGPIIEQDVIRVGHQHTPAEMARNGRDVEKIVLARALKHVLNDRVFVHGNRTVIFD